MSKKSIVNRKSKWAEKKTKLKLQFPNLTDADLDFDETRKSEMLSKLQVKVKRTVNELQTIMDTL